MKKYGYEFTEMQLTKTAQVHDAFDILMHTKELKKAAEVKKTASMSTSGFASDDCDENNNNDQIGSKNRA